MALGFGRGRRAVEPQDPFEAALRDAARDAFTGALLFEEPVQRRMARIYLLDGHVYAAAVQGLSVDPMTRLATGGHLDRATAAELARGADPEAFAVADGLVAIDAIATVHQEVLLACVGAVREAGALLQAREPDAVTSALCTLPLAVDDLLDSVEVRRTRLSSTWALVASIPPSRAVLRPVAASALPTGLAELRALAEAADGVRVLDELAGALALTRAEAVHLAAALLTSGATSVVASAASSAHIGGTLPVPEAYGEGEPVPTAHAPVEPASGVPGLPLPGAAADADRSGATWSGAEDSAPTDLVRQLEAELADAHDQQRAAAARVAALTAELARLRAGEPGPSSADPSSAGPSSAGPSSAGPPSADQSPAP